MSGIFWALLAFCAYAAAFATCVHALMLKREPQSALGWVAFILFVPYIGVICYWLFGVSRLDSYAAYLLDRKAKAQFGVDLKLDRTVIPLEGEKWESQQPEQVLAGVGYALTGREPVGGNAVHLLQNGEEAYPEMLEAIEKAQHHIYLTTYIFNSGQIGDAFADALIRAAQRGLDVRVLVDGLGGELYTLHKPWRRFAKHGIRVERFLPLTLFPPRFFINLRTHRKVLVCDGIGFTGGMNISDDHLVTPCREKKRDYCVQDIHFRCEGPVALLLEEAFLMDWAFVTQEIKPARVVQPCRCGDSQCRLVFDGLGRRRDNILELFCGVIGGARQSVQLITPYFLPPRELTSALIAAAMRGVDVSLILPAKNNLFYVHRASRHMQPALVSKGIKIYYQDPPFAHTKLMIVDNYYALVGSANLDPRSLFLNFELNMEIFDEGMAYTLHQYFDDVLARSTQKTERYYASFPMTTRLVDAFFWLFSPYL